MASKKIQMSHSLLAGDRRRFCCSSGFSVESTMALNVYGKPLIEAKAMLTGESIFVQCKTSGTRGLFFSSIFSPNSNTLY
jgi:hypothetical protein